MGKNNAYRLLMGKLEGKRLLGRPKLGGWITLTWILERSAWVVWTGLIWLRIETNGELW
jgi:hypothetical protein